MAEIRRELHVTVADEVGKLAELTDRLSAAKINIVAVCAWTEGQTGHMLLVTDDNDAAFKALEPLVDGCESAGDVICVKTGNRPGALHAVAHTLAEAGISIVLVHAAAGDHSEAVILLKTTDNARAAELL